MSSVNASTGQRGNAAALSALRRVTSNRPQRPAEERCDMCARPIDDGHPHVVNLESRSLMCTCRACYLLFTDQHADLHYRAVPDRYLSFPGFELDARQWDELQIPVGLVFLFQNSAQGRTVAFYPGPAGATESELPLEAWERIVEANPRLSVLLPDVEALLVRREAGADSSCHLVPVDACYELVGRLRMLWRGFDGGQEAHRALDDFFAQVAGRSHPAVETT
jgi:hypothetical protein